MPADEGRGESKSPKQANNASSIGSDPQADAQHNETAGKTDLKEPSNADAAKPLAPPPRPPGPQQNGNTPDYFGSHPSLSLEPNPFDQSFGAQPETPGGTKLPSVAALTSPSSLLPGSGVTPFNWGGGSLRTGPLSPAMLSGPTNDYFGDTQHLRGGFPTPNESSLRTGLTPGGSGSMFPAPSPNSAAIFASLAGGTGAATPSTIDFRQTALNAAAAKREQQSQVKQQMPPTTQPREQTNGSSSIKAESKVEGTFDNHTNNAADADAANALTFLLQGNRNGTAQSQPQFTVAAQQQQQQQQHQQQQQAQAHARPASGAVQHPNTSSQVNGNGNGNIAVAPGLGRGISEAASAMSDESEQVRPNTRGKGKRNSGGGAAGGRRKAEEPPAKAPASKKAKTNGTGHGIGGGDMDHSDDDEDEDHDDDHKTNPDGTKTKMTDDEKRKNFLERNRVAALKCRQRKKQWLANLQNKVELYQQENETLSGQCAQLRDEVVNLKTLLLAHKDCPVTAQQGLQGAYMPGMDQYNAQMNPYGMAAPGMSGHPMMAQPQGQRMNG